VTHLAITDHDRIDGALEAQARAAEEAPGLHVIVGQEIRTTAGDLIGVFLDEAIPPGLTPVEAVAAVRDQGGLVGIAHPFDRFRGSVGKGNANGLDELAASVDWIETWNARLLLGDGNGRAAELATRVGVPGVAVSDAHTTMEVGIASTILTGDPSTPDGLRGALAGPIELVMGRASAYVRLIGPAAKLVQRARGRGRVRPPLAIR
jgi:predicted metal-dependent phosphoesterase TrpH